MRRIRSAFGLDASGTRRDLALDIDDGGVLAAVGSADGPTDDLVVMPAPVNAHDHARPLRTTSIGGFGRPLEVWLHRLALLVPVDPYTASLAAFARSALGGQCAAMNHAVRFMGLTDPVAEAAEVARAARDVGIRIAFGVGMRDMNPLVYGPSEPVLDTLDPESRAEISGRFLGPMKSIDEQIALVDAIADRISGPLVDVQYAPNGPQWCSDALWEAVAEASERTGRRITTHLFETRYQRDWADRTYPQGLVRRLKEIGVLSPRLTLAHCVHARPDELEMIAEAGCIISVNTSSNLALRSGVAPVAEMLARGCRIAIGIDGQAFDEDDDALREIRLLWSLHAGWGFDVQATPEDVLRASFENGRIAVGAPTGGRLEAGAAADLLVIDRKMLDDDAVMHVDPLDLLFARAKKSHVEELIVAGRSVVKDGRVVDVDLDALQAELRARYRAGVEDRAGLRRALPALESAVRDHFLRLGCC